MSVFHDALVQISKAAVAGERVTLPPKHVFYSAIQTRADAICKDGRRSAAGRFNDCVIGDEVGRLLFAVMKMAKGPEVLEDTSAEADEPSAKPFVGEAGRMMQNLADHFLAKHPSNTPAGAYARVFAANPKLGERVKAETMAKNYGG
jgi:hypothetical protein